MKHVSERLVLDSWAIIALIKDEQPAAGAMRQMMVAAGEGSVTLWLNVINLGEIYYTTGRTDGLQAAQQAVAHLRQLPIMIDPVDEEAVLRAADFKRQRPISYANAFALATAVRLNATLVTGDPELLALGDIVAIEPLQRHS